MIKKLYNVRYILLEVMGIYGADPDVMDGDDAKAILDTISYMDFLIKHIREEVL